MRDFHIPLLPGGLYHVLNRANGNEPLFKTEANYHFFLAKYNQHISPVAQTLAWCLLPNHYHFLIRVKPSGAIRDVYHAKKEKDLESDNLLPSFIMQQFSNWQNSYAKAFNKVYQRKGSLFMDYMRRVRIDEDHRASNTVFYIHKNPVHHGLASRIDEWPFTSYREYTRNLFWMVNSHEVIEWFGTIENFIRFHQQPIERKKA